MQLTPDRFFATTRVFDRGELHAALEVPRRRTAASAESSLGKAVRAGRVRPVKRGVFVRADLALTRADLLAVGCRLARDAVLAYGTALEAHGAAHVAQEDVVFTSWSKVKPLEFEGRRFRPVKPRKELRDAVFARRFEAAVDRGGHELRVTSLERTVVDVLDRPDLASGFEEVWRACAAIPALDVDALLAYVTLLGKAMVAARVGYFLEQRKESLLVSDRALAKLERLAPSHNVYMHRGRAGTLARRWRLIVPEGLLADELGREL